MQTAVLSILFFFSGACALVYQVLWLRMFGWVFGVTVYAASAVWATFMAGLAVGSFGAGRLADRVKNPLRWFGAAELLIGATALATPTALALLQKVYVSIYPSLPQSLPSLTIARLLIAFLVLIVPTSVMGATLPLVIKASMFRASGLGSQVGLLYGSNATGAIVGTIAAGLVFIPGRGIHNTFLLAAGVNTIVGLSAIVLSTSAGMTARSAFRPYEDQTGGSRLHADEQRAQAIGHSAGAGEQALEARQLRVILAVFALSGVVSLALEVVWFRVLTLFLRPTVYGFAVMLATILGGIALGSYLVAPVLPRRAKWVAVLAAIELAIGVAVVLSFRPLVYLPSLSQQVTLFVAQFMPDYLGYPIAGSLLAIFPTALLMGIAFPIGLRVWAAAGPGEERTAERIGVFYSLNVGGAIVGSLFAGFVLLPSLGSRTSLLILATLSFGSGLALVAASELSRSLRAAAALTATLVFATAVWFSPDPFSEFVVQRYPGQRIVWQEEGVETTVVVHENRRKEVSLTVNGNHQASTDRATTYIHRRIGHLPMAIHPGARAALVIGLGGGATAGAVSIHEGVDVDVVELAGSVVRGSRFLDSINYGVMSRPNVHLRVDDGRNFLMLTQRTYDVVTADVIHPIYAGSGNLYSAEYFGLVRRVLNPGGVVVQWVAGTEAEYKTIAKTFLSVFPETTAWVDGSLLIGSVEPLQLKRSTFERKLQMPGSAQGLRDLNIQSFDQLKGAFRAGPDDLRKFVGDVPLLTDDRPLAEYFLSLSRDRDPDLSQLKGDVTRYIVPD